MAEHPSLLQTFLRFNHWQISAAGNPNWATNSQTNLYWNWPFQGYPHRTTTTPPQSLINNTMAYKCYCSWSHFSFLTDHPPVLLPDEPPDLSSLESLDSTLVFIFHSFSAWKPGSICWTMWHMMRLPSQRENMASSTYQSGCQAIRYIFILTSCFLALFDNMFHTFPEPIIQYVVPEQYFIQYNYTIVLEIQFLEESHSCFICNKRLLSKDQYSEIATIKNASQQIQECANCGQIKQ